MLWAPAKFSQLGGRGVPAATIDLKFTTGEYSSSGVLISVATLLSCARASTGYAQTSAGTLTSFAANTMRITDNGLLIEGARTNEILQSQHFDATSIWGPSSVDTTDNATTAPDGTTTAAKLAEAVAASGVNTEHYTYNTTSSVLSAVPCTFSVYVKAAGLNFATLAAEAVTKGTYAVCANLTTGAITSTHISGTPTNYSSSCELLGNGWCRLCITMDGATSRNGKIYLGLSNSATPTWGTFTAQYAGGGSGVGIYIWGAQTEVAAFPSSYIRTPALATVTRAADVMTPVSTLQSTIAAAIGSIVGQVNNGKLTGAADIVNSNGTNLLGFDATNHGLASLAGTLATANTANRITRDKVGIAWNASGRSLVLNGDTVVTDFIAQTPSVTQRIGSATPVTRFIYAYLERLSIWDSKLTSASLRGLTGP